MEKQFYELIGRMYVSMVERDAQIEQLSGMINKLTEENSKLKAANESRAERESNISNPVGQNALPNQGS